MTNAGFVSQPVVSGVGAVAGRPEQAGRKTDEGEFSDLLSRFGGRKEQTALGDPSLEAEAERPRGELQKVLSWLAGNAEALEGDRAIGNGATEHESAPNTEGALASVVAQVAGLPSVAGPTAVPKSTASQGPGTTVPLPADVAGEQPIMPSDEALEPPPVLEVTADITVLKRETHVAPGSAASGSLAEWAASMLGSGKGRVGGGTALQSAIPTAEPDVALSTGLPPGEKPQAVSSVAISPLRAAHAGTGMKQAESDIPFPAGAAGDALPDAAEAEPIAMRVAPSGSSEQAPSPVQLIAARVLQEASGAAPSTATAAPATTPQQALMSPAKVLHIQLQPAELGTVTLRMSLKHQTLRLEVEVGTAYTARLIQNDRDALSTLLRTAGYLVDGLDVRIVDPANAGPATGNGQSATQMQGGGQPQADARSSDAHSREGSPRHQSGDKGNNRHDQPVEADRRGGVFV
jgi:chemotaxis protein MotD